MACTSPENRSSGHSGVTSEENLIQPIECAHVEGGPPQAFTMPGGTFGRGKAQPRLLGTNGSIQCIRRLADVVVFRGADQYRAANLRPIRDVLFGQLQILNRSMDAVNPKASPQRPPLGQMSHTSIHYPFHDPE